MHCYYQLRKIAFKISGLVFSTSCQDSWIERINGFPSEESCLLCQSNCPQSDQNSSMLQSAISCYICYIVSYFCQCNCPYQFNMLNCSNVTVNILHCTVFAPTHILVLSKVRCLAQSGNAEESSGSI